MGRETPERLPPGVREVPFNPTAGPGGDPMNVMNPPLPDTSTPVGCLPRPLLPFL